MGVFGATKNVGSYQWTCIFLYGLSAGFFIMVNVMILLIAPRIDYVCDLDTPEYRNLTFPQKHSLMTSLTKGDGQYCQRPDVDFNKFTSQDLRNILSQPDNSSGDHNTENDSNIALDTLTKVTGKDSYLLKKCDKFVYDKSIFTLTVTEKFDLVCDRSWLLSLAKTIYMAGFLVGAITCGSLSDRFGRKIVLVCSGFLCTLWHLVCAFAPNVEVFLLGRFLLATCCIAFFTSGQILHIELVRQDQRKVPRAVQSYSVGIIGILLCGVAMVIPDYRYLQVMMSVVSLVCSLAIWLHIPESPRWLCAQKRHEEAKIIVNRIAHFNKWSVSKLDYLLHTTNTTDSSVKTTLLDLYRTPLLRKRTFILGTLWFCHILVFYALLYNMDSFWPDIRVSMMIGGCLELVTLSIPFLTIDYFGRQFMSVFFLGMCGICCLCMAPFVGLRGSPWLLAFAITGKLFASNQFFIGSVYIQELYPTNLRTQGLGMASTVARVAGMLAPQLSHLNRLWTPLSVVLMGIVAILGAMLTPALPDTTSSELPVTLEDGENFFREHVYEIQIASCRAKKRRNWVGDAASDEEMGSMTDEKLQMSNETNGHICNGIIKT